MENSAAYLKQRWKPLAASLLALVLLGMAVSVFIRFDGLYGQDSFAYYRYTIGPFRDAMPGLPPPFFWPPGYPILVWGMSLVIGETPLAGQLVSLIAGFLVVLFTVLLAREVWPDGRSDPFVPLVAGLLALFNGQLWQSSVVVMSDTTALAAATMSLWALVRYGRSGRPGWLLWAAGAMAYAIMTRWVYGFTAVLALGYAAIHLYANKHRWRHTVLAAMTALLVLLPLLLPVLRSWFNAQPLPFVGDLTVVGWDPGHAFQRQFVTTDGRQVYRWINGLFYLLSPAHDVYLTPFLAVFLLPGLWHLWQRRTRELILLVLWATVMVLFLAGIAWQNFRFTLSFLPPVAILAAIGLAWVRTKVPPRRRWLLWGYVACSLLLLAWHGSQLTQFFVTRKQADLETLSWVEAQIPADARLLAFQLTLTLQHYGRFDTYELYYLTPTEIEAMLADGTPTYLLADVPNVESQWLELTPGINYHWLRDEIGLIQLGQQRNFTLFRIDNTRQGASQ